MRDSARLAALVESEADKWCVAHKRKAMFTIEDYVGPHKDSPDWTEAMADNAMALILACSALQKRIEADGVVFHLNPKTGTTISGSTFGGFRPQDCPIGASDSAHKQGLAVDRYDPDADIDAWLELHQDALVDCGIYIEHPDSTHGWSHWTIRPPASGHHIFYP